MNRDRKGMVAAGHPATAEAGAAILKEGGNAVDAAIAAITTSFIAEPVLTAPGGGGFMLIADTSNRSILYDGFAHMPLGSALTGIKPELKAVPIDFGDTTQTFHVGQGAVGTPSLLAMLFHAHKEHGKLPLAEVLAPGVDAARSGIRLNHLQASFVKLLKPILTDTPECRSLYAPVQQGTQISELWREGDSFRNPDLANTLEMLTIEGIKEMYHGDLAKEIVKACTPYGLLGMEDMRAEQVHIRKPLAIEVLGGTLLTNPPPSSGGLLIAFATAVLDRLMQETSDMPWPILVAEGLRAASLLRREGLDSRIHDLQISEQILEPKHLIEAIAKIHNRFLTLNDDEEVREPDNRHGSTTHISVVDRDGMAVSMTSSNGEGSGIVVPGTGIHLNNMLGEEDINPLGFHALAGGATLSSMMAPSIFLENGKPSLVLGSGGSNRLRGAILQALLRYRLLGQDIESAVHAPRLHNEGCELDIEPGFLGDHERELLISLGWRLRDWQKPSVYFGGVHAIIRNPTGNLHGCGDPRRGGAIAFA
ncbi:gamma-glutamyltransferase, Threonine peptidase, MEROPS family T03 [Mariprofundus aestuarium]|uniref:Gamma-glutamyltransferase, Threonine peptidase, MEROPS family T03 n=1 Tax=Mariprofundus aestuarium TaxID=1921086 RepID=A0A2K8KYZ1_MARES|nr:gamma-glutamyltransferase [Mariprofundus aestuarium]ATX80208.1 gamma-glutamyltransferase, Threonine peptidase, MEROPS family T03 [Mariprofundus aestuarium]